MAGASRTSDPDTLRQLAEWMDAVEGERFEFKEAKSSFEFDKLLRYLCALANEGGGRVLLGVTDRRPRRVVGSAAFPQLERTRSSLLSRLPLRVDVQEIRHPDGRVFVAQVAGRPLGVPIAVDGRYWSRPERGGDELTTLSETRLREIFAESGRDFSAEVCPGATIADLDTAAIDLFRQRWSEKSGSDRLRDLSAAQLLRDAELLEGDLVRYAALVLFGTREALGRHLAQAEIVFEYRSSEAAGPAQQREEFRQGFFAILDRLWSLIDLRNDLQHYQDGLFVLDVRTFDERSVREAILNAVCHRDYQMGGSTFVRQFPRRLEIQSPGGLPFGVTLDNLLDRQAPRNRRIAEALAKCGLVERAGQGMNLMFERSIRQGKRRPDFRGTDAWSVVVTLHGELSDARLLRFLERAGRESGMSFGAHDLLLLQAVHEEAPIAEEHRRTLARWKDLGLVESVGRGKGTRYFLARRFYAAIGEQGTHTRKRGLDGRANRQLLLDHLRDAGAAGCAMRELQLVLPGISRHQIKSLLQGLAKEGAVRLQGSRKHSRWFALEDQS